MFTLTSFIIGISVAGFLAYRIRNAEQNDPPRMLETASDASHNDKDE